MVSFILLFLFESTWEIKLILIPSCPIYILNGKFSSAEKSIYLYICRGNFRSKWLYTTYVTDLNIYPREKVQYNTYSWHNTVCARNFDLNKRQRVVPACHGHIMVYYSKNTRDFITRTTRSRAQPPA